MNFRNFLQAGIFSFAGLALLTQVVSAEELQQIGNVDDLQGVVACNVEENGDLFRAEWFYPDFPAEAWTCAGDIKIGDGDSPSDRILTIPDEIKEEIRHHRDRQENPDALMVRPR